jgi:hypothetical protein
MLAHTDLPYVPTSHEMSHPGTPGRPEHVTQRKAHGGGLASLPIALKQVGLVEVHLIKCFYGIGYAVCVHGPWYVWFWGVHGFNDSVSCAYVLDASHNANHIGGIWHLCPLPEAGDRRSALMDYGVVLLS